MKEFFDKDLYEILGTTFEADVVQIKAAYRKKARAYHPDVNNNTPDSITKFKEITEAYEFLLDVQKRRQYDQIKGYARRRVETSRAQRTAAQKAYTYTSEKSEQYTKKSAPESAKENVQKTNHTNGKESFSHVFNNILDGLFPGGEKKSAPNTKSGANPNTNANTNTKANTNTTGKTKKAEEKTCEKPTRGRDINLTVTVKIAEALNGTHRTVNVLHTERCPKCEGRKFINGAKCPLCKGTGEVSIHKKLSVKIPAHIKKGAKIRIANEGNKGCNGGTDGDLFLYIDIEENSFFRYEGINVLCEIPITPYEAALGAEIEVPTLNKPVTMKVPSGTTSGQKFRLSGEGVHDEQTGTKGDQIVTVKIEMPKDLSPEEKTLYEKLKGMSHHTIRENLGNV